MGSAQRAINQRLAVDRCVKASLVKRVKSGISLDKAQKMIAEARGTEDLSTLKNMRLLAEAYAGAVGITRRDKLEAEKVHVLAIRKAGEIFDKLERGKTGPKLGAADERNSDYREALDNTGIKKRTAEVWQSFARTVSEKALDDYFESVHLTDDKDITVAGAMRFAGPQVMAAAPKELKPDDRYRRLYDFVESLYSPEQINAELKAHCIRLMEDCSL